MKHWGGLLCRAHLGEWILVFWEGNVVGMTMMGVMLVKDTGMVVQIGFWESPEGKAGVASSQGETRVYSGR